MHSYYIDFSKDALLTKKENLETGVVSRFSLVEISGIEPLTS